MDIVVSRVDQTTVWELRDLLGRLLGTITQEERGFFVSPAGEAVNTMRQVNRSPYSTLDAALTEIETRTRGVCRRNL